MFICSLCIMSKINPIINVLFKSPEIRLRNLQIFCDAFVYRQRCTTVSARSKNPVIMKLNSPTFYSIFTPELKKLEFIFSKYSYELRIVGGAVRDLLLGERPSDLDFATTATPDEMRKIFTTENIRMIDKKGEKYGTVTSRIDDRANFEITSLRTDLYCDGRHAQVLFVTDWEKDAARRDLTINALYLGLDGSVYDYVNGYADLMNRKVLFVGNPEMRMEEDYLRILRYFRFFGKVAKDANSHDQETLKAIQRQAHGLAKISGERIWSELHRILHGNFKKEIMETMMDLGITQYMGLGKPDELDKTCFRTACQRDLKYTLKPITLIASLLTDENKALMFHARMRLSNYDRDLALFIVYHKGDNSSLTIDEKLDSMKYLLACTQLDKKRMREYIVELLKFKNEEELLRLFEAWELPQFPINADIIKEAIGTRDLKKINVMLQKLKHLWISSGFQMKLEDLLEEMSHFKSDEAVNKKESN